MIPITPASTLAEQMYYSYNGPGATETQLPIPPFEPNGLLPTYLGNNPGGAIRSPYEATIVELVSRFHTSDDRKELLQGLIAYRQLIRSDGYEQGYQFINGSFVEDVETIRGQPPADIDLVSFLVRPQKYVVDQNAWETAGKQFWLNEVRGRAANKARFSLDAIAVMLDEADYRKITYWHGLFSEQRRTFAPKGYIVVHLDPAADQVALASMERK